MSRPHVFASACVLSLLGVLGAACSGDGTAAQSTAARTAQAILGGSPPTVNSFTVDNAAPTERQTVTFTVSASVGGLDPPITNYHYDFGDGSPGQDSANNTIPYAYPKAGSYNPTVVVSNSAGDSAPTNVAVTVSNAGPSVTPVANGTATEATLFTTQIQASDADTPLGYSVTGPTGMSVSGTGLVSWTPTFAQCGAPPTGKNAAVIVRVTDALGGFTDVAFTVAASWVDSDGDGMPDSWENTHGENAHDASDATQDRDNDGVDNLDEFHNANGGPYTPLAVTLRSPTNGMDYQQATLTLSAKNTTDPDTPSGLRYRFQIFTSTNTALAPLYSSPDPGVAQGSGANTNVSLTTATVALVDDHTYYWRVKALDGVTQGGPWSPLWSFRYDPVDDPPSAPQIQTPPDGSGVITANPTLIVDNATDADSTVLTYRFSVYDGPDAGSPLLEQSPVVPQGGNGSTSWTATTALLDLHWYRWNATVYDDRGASTTSVDGTFRVHFGDLPPTAPQLALADGTVEHELSVTLAVKNATDPDGDALQYQFEWDVDPSFNTAAHGKSPLVPSGAGGTTPYTTPPLAEDGTYVWRARATDGTVYGDFVTGHFSITTRNDPPPVPVALEPADGGMVKSTDALELTVRSDPDPEGDAVTYDFELREGSDGGKVVSTYPNVAQTPEKTFATVLAKPKANQVYAWTARAKDTRGGVSAWMPSATFVYRTPDGCSTGGLAGTGLGIIAVALGGSRGRRRRK